MKVENMTSSSGNAVANQFIITDNNATYFQSYESIIVKRENGKTYLDEIYWNYSEQSSRFAHCGLSPKR